MKKQAKFGVVAALILGTLVWLGWVGVTESKTYYHTIAELTTLPGEELRLRIRVGGDVQPGSIERRRGGVDFVLEQEGHALPVTYIGRDPLPDTFVDRAQALVEGRMGPDGRFQAEHVQAKCASKYEAAPEGQPGYAPPAEKSQTAAPGSRY